MTMTATTTTADAARLRQAGLAGLTMPVLFIAVAAFLTWVEYDFLKAQGMDLTEDYDARIPWPSGLARGSWGWLQTVNFLILGALAAVFLRGLVTRFRRGWAARVATAFLGLYAFDGLLNAMRVDLGDENTIWGWTHYVGFGLIHLCVVVGVPAAGLALRRDPAFRGLWQVSLAWPVLLVAAHIVGDAAVPGALGFVPALLVLTGWFALAGHRLRRIARNRQPAVAQGGRVTGSS